MNRKLTFQCDQESYNFQISGKIGAKPLKL